MADVFLSYAREDRERAEPLARALQDAGWNVWWDRSILPGSSYETVIEHELSSARCVVVLWSHAADDSNWVRDEAAAAQARDVLVSVLIDGTEPPLGFRQQQTANLTAWNGAVSDPEFRRLAEGIAALAGGGTIAAPAPPISSTSLSRSSRPPMTAGGRATIVVAACALIGAVGWAIAFRPRDPALNARASEAAASQVLVVPAQAEATLPREQITLTVVSGTLERLNASTRLLSLRIRFANRNTRNFDRTYYTDVRLLVDEVSLAPTRAPMDQIEASSAKDMDYAFEVPAAAARGVLRVTRGDESADVPLALTGARR